MPIAKKDVSTFLKRKKKTSLGTCFYFPIQIAPMWKLCCQEQGAGGNARHFLTWWFFLLKPRKKKCCYGEHPILPLLLLISLIIACSISVFQLDDEF